jgi:hypothetical protein
MYRVVNAEDLTNEETVGAEIRRLHRTAEGAWDAIEGPDWDGADWDEEWGNKPVLEVAEVAEYETEADAVAAGWEVVA